MSRAVLHEPQVDPRVGGPRHPRPQQQAAGAAVAVRRRRRLLRPVHRRHARHPDAVVLKVPTMPEYQLYCFAQSGNAYRAALMLNLIGADWQPIYVDFFKGGETRTPKYRAEVNELGEVPVLVHGTRKLTQSGVILTYLSDRTGQFRPDGEDERLEALRWIIWDNQKVNGFLGPYRFLRNFARPPGDP